MFPEIEIKVTIVQEEYKRLCQAVDDNLAKVIMDEYGIGYHRAAAIIAGGQLVDGGVMLQVQETEARKHGPQQFLRTPWDGNRRRLRKQPTR